jgi:hypothetical protein
MKITVKQLKQLIREQVEEIGVVDTDGKVIDHGEYDISKTPSHDSRKPLEDAVKQFLKYHREEGDPSMKTPIKDVLGMINDTVKKVVNEYIRKQR